MNKILHILIAVLLIACVPPRQKGNMGDECKPDGTCNNELVCIPKWNGNICDIKTVENSAQIPSPPRNCYYESECFCTTCAEKCGSAGVKSCIYSDTSVWGSKPAICECK